MPRPSHRTQAARPADDGASGALAGEIQRHGLRPTRARQVILSHLRRTPEHPTVDELRSMLHDHGHVLGQATVYQNLERLVDAGLITRFLDSRGLFRFDANQAQHHHLLCMTCGRISDVDVDAHGAESIGRIAAGLATATAGWQISDTQLELRGTCPACRAEAQDPPTT